MIEHKYWGLLTSEEFNAKLYEFTKKFGPPIKKVRLSLEASDWDREEIDNRIKITNGEATFVQKIGDWNTRNRTEVEVPLVPEVNAIFNFYKALLVLINAKRLAQTIMQHENYIFDLPEFELKLSHQSGKCSKYNFEVELKNNSKDLKEICDALGLQPDNTPKVRAFWEKWNEELNLCSSDLTDQELKNLILKYLQIK